MLQYPLTLSFKLLALSPQIRVVDATGATVLYVKQKAFRLKEDVVVFADDTQQQPRFRIKADRILDFSARYSITTSDEQPLGMIRREGMRSLWSARYPIANAEGEEIGLIREENPWVKVADGLFEMIPILGALSGYVFHPAYLVELRGQLTLRVQKEPAFFEGRFKVEQHQETSEQDEALLLTSLLMMVLLERSRG